MVKVNAYILFFLTALYSCALNAQNTLRLCPDNHHYLEYKNKPVILITSGEHYGALINLGFNYITYFDALQKNGMNNTRIFSGAYVEGEKDISWMQYNNTLAPQPGKLVTPWKRSNIPGYANGGNKFDLDRWDDAYFKRLKDLIKQAAQRNIMVEFTLFGNQYGDGIYKWSPLHPDNNIQHVGIQGKDAFLYFQSLKDSALVTRQDAMVVKVLKELNEFDNLYFEISNEPYNEVKDSALVNAWHEHIVKLIRETEENLPKKHLIASNQAIVDNPDISIANYHYVHIPGTPGYDSLLSLNKVISMNETMGSLKDEDANDVRIEAWDLILRGGGAYNNLSWEYTPINPSGTPGSGTVGRYLQYLQKFISSFNFIKMNYAPELLNKVPDSAITRLLAEPGKQYALYIHYSTPDVADPSPETAIWKYEADTAAFRDTISLHLKAGSYEAKWYNTVTGEWIDVPFKWKQKDGTHTFYTPLFTTDIALKITGR